MTLPASGALSMSAIDTELGQSSTLNQSMDWVAYRQLAGVSRKSGSSYSMSSFYSKTAPGTPFTLTTNGNTGTTLGGGSWEPYGIVTHPNGNFVYVTDQQYSLIGVYTRNSSTGTLTYYTTTYASSYIAGMGTPFISPNGNYLVVPGNANTEQTLTAYGINTSTGALIGPVSYVGGSSWGTNACFDPAGTAIYVAGTSSSYITKYPFNSSTGVIGSLSNYYATGSGNPSQAVVHPNGNFVYVTDYTFGVIFLFNPSLGYINNYFVGTNPIGIAISPDGAYLYTAASGSNLIYIYSVNSSTGALTYITTYGTGSSPTYIAISPDGASLYVTCQASAYVSAYARNLSNGYLSSPTTYGTAAYPTGVCVSPDNNSVYVACFSGPSASNPGIYGYQR